jgi:hypothetical protein
MVRRIVAAVVVLVPLVAVAYAMPDRVAHLVAGVSCVQGIVCVDDSSRISDAEVLYGEALSFVSSSIGPLNKKPLVIFCSTESCYHAFGFSDATAKSVGGFAIVISPRGWKPYVVRHEMIHRLQVQELGVIRMYLEPEWFIEGMAYSLSEDPRAPLAEPFESFRSRFASWNRARGNENLWEEARKL